MGKLSSFSLILDFYLKFFWLFFVLNDQTSMDRMMYITVANCHANYNFSQLGLLYLNSAVFEAHVKQYHFKCLCLCAKPILDSSSGHAEKRSTGKHSGPFSGRIPLFFSFYSI